MMSETQLQNDLEMYKRIKLRNPDDAYWDGAIMVLIDILKSEQVTTTHR